MTSECAITGVEASAKDERTAEDMIKEFWHPIKKEFRVPPGTRLDRAEDKSKNEGKAGADGEGFDLGDDAAEGAGYDDDDAEVGQKRRGQGEGQHEEGKKRSREFKGQNKGYKRGQQKKENIKGLKDTVPSLCGKIARGATCPFGDLCKFPHDVKSFAEECKRMQNLNQFECPSKASGGTCRFGANCMVGTCRADWLEILLAMAEKKDVPDAEKSKRDADESVQKHERFPGTNVLSRELQGMLREVKGKAKMEYVNVWREKEVLKKEIEAERAAAQAQREAKKEEGEGGGGTAAGTADVSRGEETMYDHGARLRPEEKKKIDFEGKTYLAPLTTVGNLPFRRLVKGLGCDITCGEMAMSRRILDGAPTEWALLRRHPSEDVFGVQIACGHGDDAGKVVEIFERECNIDFVDLNCGCPLDGVCHRGMGAELMEKGNKLREIVSLGSRCSSIPFTVKLRVGPTDLKRTAHTLIPRLQQYGACAVTVHGRSRQARYTRLADWEYIKECANVGKSLGLPIIGNGDVLSWEEYHAHREQHGVSTCLIGRGALIKPWLFTEIRERRYWDIRSSERLELMRDFCRYGLDHWGSDAEGVEKTRSFLLEWQAWTCRYVPVGVLEVLPQMLNLRNPGFVPRDDLEGLMAGTQASDWVKISTMLLGPPPSNFKFIPKHKSSEKSSDQAAEG